MKRILFGLFYILFYPVIFCLCLYLESNQVDYYEIITGTLICFGFLFNIALSFIEFDEKD